LGQQLPLENPWAWAIGLCACAVIAEGILTGVRVRERFTELQLPKPRITLFAWSAIGSTYYIVMLMVAHTLFSSVPVTFWTAAAIALVVLLMASNGAWNWLFFRRRSLFASLLFFIPYNLIAFALAFALARIGGRAVWWYAPNIGYLVFVTWWAYMVWRLNPVNGNG
jgi:tryptophan-rich sensory protein